jgi:hypothetical protein
MFSWKGTLGLAVCAALASATMAHGGETASSPVVPDQLSLNSNPAYLDDTTQPPPPPPPLMGALSAIPGVGGALAATGITIGGFVEGGYTYSFNPPPGKYITGNIFNIKQNRVVLDQADIAVTRTVDPTAGKFDIGAKIEFIYGWDAGAIHSNGLFSYLSRTQPENQFDLVQAYADVVTPIKNLDIRFGKFVTLLGQETINPTGNALYSHTYLFGDAIPFTQTGVLLTYNLTDAITVEGGITRGWGQSLRDNNGAIDFLGEVSWQVDKATKLILNVSEGPQAAKDNSDYWTVIDFIASRTMSDQLSIAFNADYGDAPHALGTTSAQWYGGALYGTLTLDSHLAVTMRGEAYDDQDGFTTGLAQRVYEATLGVTITPFPDNAIGKNLEFRPEVRYDYSDRDFFNGGTRHDQVQCAMDAIFQF